MACLSVRLQLHVSDQQWVQAVNQGIAHAFLLQVPEPEFEGQTKTRLGNPEVRKIVENIVAQVSTCSAKLYAGVWHVLLSLPRTSRGLGRYNLWRQSCAVLSPALQAELHSLTMAADALHLRPAITAGEGWSAQVYVTL